GVARRASEMGSLGLAMRAHRAPQATGLSLPNTSHNRPARACRTGRSEIASLTKRTASTRYPIIAREEKPMKLSRWWALAPVVALFAGAASANDELIKLSKDPNQWVMPSG